MTIHQVWKDDWDKGESGMRNDRWLDNEAVYEIRVLGRLDPSWADWFDGFTISNQHGETIITGMVADQAALLGILTKIGHLNLPLLSVTMIGDQDERKGKIPCES